MCDLVYFMTNFFSLLKDILQAHNLLVLGFASNMALMRRICPGAITRKEPRNTSLPSLAGEGRYPFTGQIGY